MLMLLFFSEPDLSADQGWRPAMLKEWSHQAVAVFIEQPPSLKTSLITYTLSCDLHNFYGDLF